PSRNSSLPKTAWRNLQNFSVSPTGLPSTAIAISSKARDRQDRSLLWTPKANGRSAWNDSIECVGDDRSWRILLKKSPEQRQLKFRLCLPITRIDYRWPRNSI